MPIDGKIINRILRKAGVSDLLTALVQRLNNDDLQSLLMQVAAERTAKLTLADVRRQFAGSRFLCPSVADPRDLLEFDRLAFATLDDDVEAVELSPLAPQGVCSQLATVDQNNVLTTIRNNEVTADSTNVMSLICADRRAELLGKNPRDKQQVHMACSGRMVRTQFIDKPGFFGHFKIFAQCSAGSDIGNWGFESSALLKQLHFYLRLLENLSEINLTLNDIEVRMTVLAENRRQIITQEILPPLKAHYPQIKFLLDDQRQSGRGYYLDCCFQINGLAPDGSYQFLVDGGFTDWTQKLLNNRKERLLISGLGSERLVLSCRDV